MYKRTLLLLAALAASLACAGAHAQSAFPDKPVRLVIGFPAGSATDIASRIVANKMSELLGQQVVVDNRPGASTSIAAVAVAKRKAYEARAQAVMYAEAVENRASEEVAAAAAERDAAVAELTSLKRELARKSLE